jgi:hypothetical protein
MAAASFLSELSPPFPFIWQLLGRLKNKSLCRVVETTMKIQFDSMFSVSLTKIHTKATLCGKARKSRNPSNRGDALMAGVGRFLWAARQYKVCEVLP